MLFTGEVDDVVSMGDICCCCCSVLPPSRAMLMLLKGVVMFSGDAIGMFDALKESAVTCCREKLTRDDIEAV